MKNDRLNNFHKRIEGAYRKGSTDSCKAMHEAIETLIGDRGIDGYTINCVLDGIRKVEKELEGRENDRTNRKM